MGPDKKGMRGPHVAKGGGSMNPAMYQRGLRMLETAIATLEAAGSVVDVAGANLAVEAGQLEARLSMLRDEMGRRSAAALGPKARGWPETDSEFLLRTGVTRKNQVGWTAASAALPQGDRTPRRRKGVR